MSTPVTPTGRRERLAAFAIVSALALLPVAVSELPPITDLPQQLHQVVLAERAARGLEPDLVVRPFAPNRLGYLPLAGGWFLGGPEHGPRFAIALVSLLLLGAIHLAAARLRVPVANTVLASIFVWNADFYLGLFNFELGLLGLLLWTVELEREVDPGDDSFVRRAAGAFAASALLLLAHAFWFAAGTALAISTLLLRRFRARPLLARLAGIAPVALGAATWAGGFGASGWQTALAWPERPFSPFGSLTAFSSLVLGGLHGLAEPMAVAIALAVIVLGLVRLRGRDGSAKLHGPLAAAGLACLVAAIALPARLDQTALFAARWAPFSLLLLLLAVPAPAVRPALARALAYATFAAFLAATTAAWLRFDRVELAGFDEALAAIPEGATVLGLEYASMSPSFRVPPTPHLHVYAAIRRGARVSQSFAQWESSLVTFRDPENPPPHQLSRDWIATILGPGILHRFDFALVHGSDAFVERVASSAPGVTVARAGPPWTLLAIERSAAGARSPGP